MEMKDRLRYLDSWLFDKATRNGREVMRMAKKATAFPFTVTRRGKSPDREEYLAIYSVFGKHPDEVLIAPFLLERERPGENPKICFDPGSLLSEAGLEVNGGCVVEISSHAISRYVERYLKESGTINDSELVRLLDSIRHSTCKIDQITSEVTHHTEHGLFLGSLDNRTRTIVLKTFVADHNLYAGQSMEKRKLRDFRDQVKPIFMTELMASKTVSGRTMKSISNDTKG